MALPGLPGFPPLNISAASAARSAIDSQGSMWDFGGGAWNVNLGGTGTASGVPGTPWLLLGAALLGALWLLKK